MSYFVPLSRACVYAALTAPADTTIAAANTYQYVNGTFSNTPIKDFEFVGSPEPAIKYVGIKPAWFVINGSFNYSVSAPNKTVSLAIKHNTTVLTDSIVSLLCVRASELYSGSGIAVVYLSPNDTIQIVITTDGTGNVVTVNNLITTIRAFIR